MSLKSSEIKPIAYSCNGKTLTFIKPQIMAIVNITPDSFYDGGKFSSSKDILLDVEDKIRQGANIIDLGAASSRPNAIEISLDEEWNRLHEALVLVRKTFPQILISIDTYRSEIAKRSANMGADIINDIGGGNLDLKMFETIATLNLPYILMHMQGTPQNMKYQPAYKNVTQSIKKEFSLRIAFLQGLGFNKIILDPGFGFGKSLENNYRLLKELRMFEDFGFPILTGISRKSMINKVIGTNPVTALNGTSVLHTVALLNGASILRVHDVQEAKQAIELLEFYKNA
jgi:dihydropteroate synthase